MSTDTGSPTVVKVSGTLLDDPDALAELWPALCTLRAEGPVVLVHGGGTQMTALADRLGLPVSVLITWVGDEKLTGGTRGCVWACGRRRS